MTQDDLDVLLEPPHIRIRRVAERVKTIRDVELPRLSLWNYDACRYHEKPEVHCQYRLCGGDPFRHQRIGSTWLYLAKKGILADETGLGKSAQTICLICLMKERQESVRTLIVCQPGAIEQVWLRDFRRFAPRLLVEPAVGDRYLRYERYAGGWDVLLIGFQMMLRDLKVLKTIPFDLIVSDDVPALLHEDTQTFHAYNDMVQSSPRVVQINATPLNLRLEDLYALAVPLGARRDFGSFKAFKGRYVRSEQIRELNESTGRPVTRWVKVGYKNMEEFREKFGPYFLRRRYEDVEDDVSIPSVAPVEDVWLDLYPQQRERYAELQRGIVTLLQRFDSGEMGEHEKYVNAMTAFGYGAQICSGLQNLGEPDGPGASVKLDWLVDKVTGDWAREKVVVFSQYKGVIRSMRERFARENVGMAIIWGDTPGGSQRKLELRKEEEDRFWEDPNCRVAVGTSAIERSLNFQIARVVVNYDLLLNPQRMVQILGRVRRVGSQHKRVYPVNLLTIDTQEERYLPVLEQRAAVADYVFGGQNPLYKALDPIALLHLIRP